jgi:hypothetical protein
VAAGRPGNRLNATATSGSAAKPAEGSHRIINIPALITHGTANPNPNVMIKRLVSLGRHQTFDHDGGASVPAAAGEVNGAAGDFAADGANAPRPNGEGTRRECRYVVAWSRYAASD